MNLRLALLTAAIALLAATGAEAHTPPRPAPVLEPQAFDDSRSIGTALAAAPRAEPPLTPVPRAACDAGSRPETEIQGRVSAQAIAGPAKEGYWCNLARVAQVGRSGGFKVQRYIDKAGHECAYFDTALLVPLNALNLVRESVGVAVLDMADPAKPVQTDTLSTPAMLSPHESVVLNQRRGLLAAVAGNPAFAPGVVDVYDVSGDCRHPVLQSSAPVGVLGHESGFTADGLTFYSASPASKTTVAVDLSDPKTPKVLWAGNIASHGLTLSADGTRAYVAAVNTVTGVSGLEIYDTSQVQARATAPQVRKVSSLTWETVSIPQNAIPVTIKGKPYVIEMDEYRQTSTARSVGAGRIIDISDETAPRVVSNLRLAIHQPENQAKFGTDPGADSPTQGYAGHYCEVPRRQDPDIVACSMIASGLRVFDIRDPAAPKEVAYHVAPPTPKIENRYDASNFAMSAPAFVPERREVWYTDGTSGFYNLRLSEPAWPTAAGAPTTPATPRRCTSRRVITITTKKVRRLRLARVVALARGKRVGRSSRRRVTVRLRGFAGGPVTVRLRITGRRGGRRVTVTQTRRYRLCRSGQRSF